MNTPKSILNKIATRDLEGIERAARKLSHAEWVTLTKGLYPDAAATPDAAPAAPKAPQKSKNPGSDKVSATVDYDRTWTWVKFDGKPSDAIREALKKRYPSARFSTRREAWYIQETVSAESLTKVLGIKVTKAA